MGLKRNFDRVHVENTDRTHKEYATAAGADIDRRRGGMHGLFRESTGKMLCYHPDPAVLEGKRAEWWFKTFVGRSVRVSDPYTGQVFHTRKK